MTAFFSAATVWATDYTWTGGGSAQNSYWANENNWSPTGIPGTGDNVYFTGESTVNVEINQDVEIADLHLNSVEEGTVRFTFSPNASYSGSDYSLTCDNFYFYYDKNGNGNETDLLYGKISCNTFETKCINDSITDSIIHSGDEQDYSFVFTGNAVFEIKEKSLNLYSNDSNFILKFKNQGTVVLPYSGDMVDYLDYEYITNGNGYQWLDFSSIDCEQYQGAPTYYKIEEGTSRQNFYLSRYSTSGKVVYYKYKVTAFTGTEATDDTGSFYIYDEESDANAGDPTGLSLDKEGRLMLDNSSPSKLFWIDDGDALSDGDTITLTIYTPDTRFKLGEFTYTYQTEVVVEDFHTYYWTGADTTDSGAWNKSANWAFKDKDRNAYVSVAEYDGGAYDGCYPGYDDGDTAVFDAGESANDLTLEGSGYKLTLVNSSGSSSSAADRGTIKGYGANAETADIIVDGYFLFDSVAVNSLVTNSNSKIQVTTYSAINDRECSYASAGLSVASTFTLDSSSEFTSSDGTETDGKPTLIVGGNTENNGAISFGAGSAKFEGDYSGTGSFTASSTDTFFYGNADFSSCSGFSAGTGTGTVYFITSEAKKLTTFAGQAFNILRFGGNVTIDVSAGDITVYSLAMDADAAYFLSADFSAKITGGKKITCSQGVFLSRLSNTNGVVGTLELDCNLDAGSAFKMYSGSGLIVDENRTITISGSQTDFSNSDRSNLINVKGTLDASSVNLSFGYTTFVVGANGSVTADSLAFGSNSITNDGKINCSNLTVGTASPASQFSIDGSGTFVVTGGTAALTNLSIGSNVKIEKVDGTLVAGAFDVTDGLPSAGSGQSDYLALYKNGWNLDYDFVYTWVGGSSLGHRTWSYGENWDLGIVPGVNSSSGNTTGARVLIPAGCTYYPNIQRNDISIGTLEIEANALVTINNTSGLPVTNTDSSLVTLKNSGTIEYQSTGRITDGTNPINDVENNGTVQYSGTAQTVTDFSSSGTDYANLLITGSAGSTADILLTGDFTVSGSGSFEATAGTITFSGSQPQTITTDDSSNSTSTKFFNIEIGSSSSVETASSFTVAGDFTNNADSNGFTASAGSVIFTGNATISGNNTFANFECNVAGASLKFEAGKTQTVTSSFKINGASASKISLTTAASSPLVSDTSTWWILDTPLSAVDVTHAIISYSTSSSDIITKIDVEANDNEEPSAAKFSTANWFERKYYWLGVSSSSWADSGNWFYDTTTSYPASVPNDGSDTNSSTKRIIIATTGNDLILEKDISVKSLTINDDKTLDFAAYSVSADDSDSSTTDFNAGDGVTLRFQGSGTDLSANASSISASAAFGSDIMFEYYGGGNVTALSGSSGAVIPENQILKITNKNDGTVTRLQLGSQNIEVASTDDGFNEGIIEINGSGELSFSDSSLSMTSGLVLYSGGSGNLPDVGFYNLQIGGGSRTVATDLACENFYFTGGSLSLAANVTAAKDFAAFGSAYSVKDSDWHVSENSRFAYPSGSDDFLMPSSPSATFGSISGSLTVGENFYVNGADISDLALILPAKTALPALNATDAASATMWGKPYSVAFNMTAVNCSVSCSDGTSSVYVAASSPTTKFTHQNVTDGGGNTNWIFDSVEILSAYSVSDNIIAVELNTELSKIAQNGSISNKTHLSYNDGQKSFSGLYSNKACTTALNFTSSGKIFYIKSADTWNTDADGTTKGSDDSTNLSGVKKDAKIDLSLIEGFFYLKDGCTLSAEYSYNSSDNKAYTDLEDRVSPILIAVYTGQEGHVTPAGSASATNYSSDVQKPYDAHNFIEFRYSEPVSLGDLAFDETSENALLNIEAQSAFDTAASHGGAIVANGSSGFTVTGFGSFSDGSLSAGYKSGSAPAFTGTTDIARPHALYRKFSLTSGGSEEIYPCRLRLSIAGKIDGTVTMNGASFYNWIGYIDSAKCPIGTFAISENANITDKNGNVLNHTKNASLAVKQTAGLTNELYGSWDVTPPGFATYVTNTDGSDPALCWSEDDSPSRQYEIAGSVESNTSAYLERIEMHLFDNHPEYSDTDTYKWITQKGWMTGATVAYATPESEGGSRPFADSPKTKGGIRRSSLNGAYANFSYTYKLDLQTSEAREFAAKDVSQNAKSALFRQDSESETNTENDGLYLAFALNPSDLTLPLRTTFVVTFKKENAFITDLAGNRLSQTDDGVTKRLGGLDITPPSFSMVVSPVGSDKLFAIFTKPLGYKGEYLKGSLSSELHDHILNNIEFVYSAGDNIDTTSMPSGADEISVTDVALASHSNAYTALLFTLSRKITLSDVEKIWIRIKQYGDSSAGDGNLVAYIQDFFGNGIPIHTCHAISDFAVNAVDVIYAYTAPNDDNWQEQNVYGTTAAEGYSVHDFSADGGNYQKLLYDRDITFQIQFADYDNSSESLVAPNYSLSLVYDKKSSLKSSWVSDRFNLLTALGWRLWTDKPMSSLASSYNDSGTKTEMALTFDDPTELLQTFELKNELVHLSDGADYQFFFKIKTAGGGDIDINHDGDSLTSKIPLYAFWMPQERINAGDFSFVDLWSFSISGVSKQRGGVSILNNVINPETGERTAIEVDMKSAGNLNIFVMTLDGNIIRRLEKGTVSEGTHFYYWDGKNNAGNSVARGLYFVRVTGNGIDETRKVMVVK
ncbi:MAG: hypothetical protein J6N81_04385 [Treponema sp.]|nr:hypothetical protein [Treponema sp.]